MKKNILLSLSGMTPHCITQTLYSLTQQQRERVDEIRVITTLNGRDKIITGFVDGRGRAEESLLHPEKGRFYEFCRDYPEQTKGIKFDESCLYILTNRKAGIPSFADPDEDRLKDIRTAEDNECIANQICEIVRELTIDSDVRLHASAAGGRKTMSMYLMAAMQLFGRVQDRLSYVIVNEEFAIHPDFFLHSADPTRLRDQTPTKLDFYSNGVNTFD
jgi:CRISPR-associated protein (TIGR02584 family)